MKDLLKLLFAVVISASIFTACKGDSTETNTEVADHSSASYDLINFADGGDFLNLNSGDSKETAKSKLASMVLKDEGETTLSFLEEKENYKYYLDIYFEKEELHTIEVRVYFFDANDAPDLDACSELYDDWKSDLTLKYGKTEEKIDGDKRASMWKEDGTVYNLRDGDQIVGFYIYPI